MVFIAPAKACPGRYAKDISSASDFRECPTGKGRQSMFVWGSKTSSRTIPHPSGQTNAPNEPPAAVRRS